MLAFWNRSVITFFGGGILSLMILGQAALVAYRIWQIRHNRLFQRTLPFRDFLSAIFRRPAGRYRSAPWWQLFDPG
jgi:hypothetical protein